MCSKKDSGGNERTDLQNEPDGIDGNKVPVSRLVAKKRHGEAAADCAAEEREKQQRLFGRAPVSLFCSALVMGVQAEGDKGDQRKCAAEDIKNHTLSIIMHFASRVNDFGTFL